jgi:hypothetical protein
MHQQIHQIQYHCIEGQMEQTMNSQPLGWRKINPKDFQTIREIHFYHRKFY